MHRLVCFQGTLREKGLFRFKWFYFLRFVFVTCSMRWLWTALRAPNSKIFSTFRPEFFNFVLRWALQSQWGRSFLNDWIFLCEDIARFSLDLRLLLEHWLVMFEIFYAWTYVWNLFLGEFRRFKYRWFRRSWHHTTLSLHYLWLLIVVSCNGDWPIKIDVSCRWLITSGLGLFKSFHLSSLCRVSENKSKAFL